MNAYLFTGLASQYHQGHYVDACSNIILYGGENEAASRKAFEHLLLGHGSQEHAAPTKIEKIVSAPVLEQLLTETGHNPIHWPELAQEVLRILEATPLDEQGQGYWVDCEQCVRPDHLAPGVDWLQRELPEEVRSGLNWSADKSYFFLISVLSPPSAPAGRLEETIEHGGAGEDRSQDEEDEDDAVAVDFEQQQAAFPQLAEKELAAVVRARNSVIAAWVWRKHAAGTRLAGHAIRVDALCDLVPIGENIG